MPRWSILERRKIAEVRARLGKALIDAPQYPEVVGDRKILRFLRGHKYSIDKAAEMMGKFLQWRKDFRVDEMRHNIVSGGMDHPTKFPNGEKILRLIPQLVITTDSVDKSGSPICVDQYKFKPAVVLAHIPLSDYLVFNAYCLEYRSLIVEQLCEKLERDHLAKLSHEEFEREIDPYGSGEPFGVLKGTLVIRDIAGVGLDHMSEVGRQIIKAVVVMGSDNYPELLTKCFLINVPWIFHTLWYFIKGLLTEATQKKIALCGKDFHAELGKDLDRSLFPSLIGGPYGGGQDVCKVDWNVAFLVDGYTIESEVVRREPKDKREMTDLDTNIFLDRGSSEARTAELSWMQKVQEYTFDHPLWMVCCLAYLMNLMVSGQWRSIYPLSVVVVAMWGFMIVVL